MILRPAFPFLEYALDYEYISTVLCENKDKPELKCNGKCYLMQALAEASEKEADQKKKSTTSTIELLPFIIEVSEITIPVLIAEETKKTFTFSTNLIAREAATGLFRPPIV